jgi:hypothetical protein
VQSNKLTWVGDEQAATALADLLNGDDRVRPVVVVTIPAGRGEPFIDPESILDQVGDLADLYVMPTGSHSWTFSDRMPELTQVYGGAGRVYPVGHDWVRDPYKSPLRFAYNEDEGERATRALISDALRMAAAAGLTRPSSTRRRVRVMGEVLGCPTPERALAKVDGQVVSIQQELTVPGVALNHVVAIGMRVTGWLEHDIRRLDISDNLQPADQALAHYTLGAVVLVEVKWVEEDRAELLLYPRISVVVTRDDVTGNDLDDLRTLMTPGEVLSARVTSTGPDWQLSLLDVDDHEVPVRAAALLPGGPPWLQPPPEDAPPFPLPDEAGDSLPKLAPARPTVEAPVAPTAPVTPSAQQVPSAVPRPTPAVLDKRRALRPTTQPSAPAATSMALTIETLRAQVASLSNRLESTRTELLASNADRTALVDLRRGLERDVARLEHELQVQRGRLRKAKRPSRGSERAGPSFADPEQGFRYAVLTAWATRTPPAEQASRPLPDYDIGPEFIPSLDGTPGVNREKVADVVFEVLTDRARDIAGRDLHQLRESASPNAPYVRRSGDEATCWRAALQINTPQARRIHYWVIPGGRVELSRVALHDEFRP